MAALPNPEDCTLSQPRIDSHNANINPGMVNSTEAFNISLVAPSKSGLQPIASFHPKFTYPIFGDEERIFGYQKLKINLRYRANDMRPHLKVSHSKKAPTVGEDEPLDIPATLQEGNHLPAIAFQKEADFEESSKHVDEDYTPPGEIYESFEGPDGQYEIWKGSMTDPAVQQLNSRVQILVPFFIEGGSYICQRADSETADDDFSDADRWTLFFLYKKEKSVDNPEKHTYVFVGYSTIYRFYWFTNPTPPASPATEWELPKGDQNMSEIACRTRLSQFIILPCFQGKGHGAKLYQTIFAHYHKHPQTQEFTVEDPNEAFDDLRDVCDMQFLRNNVPAFKDLRIDTSVAIPKSGPLPKFIVGGEKLEDIRRETKIAHRQFYRLLELHLMSQLPESVRPAMIIPDDIASPSAADKHQERLWQLLAKERLYRHNKEQLSQLEVFERKEKLAEVLMTVELGNARILALVDRAQERSQGASNGKRKLEDDAGESSNKRARVEDA